MKVGDEETFETKIAEDALLLAKCLRYERKKWGSKLAAIHKLMELLFLFDFFF